MPRTITGAKIALLDIDLRKTKMAMGVQVVVTDVSKLEDIRKREADITKERIDLILGTGANVILTTKVSPPPSLTLTLALTPNPNVILTTKGIDDMG